MTSRLSTPTERSTRPISLAKLILTAWNALQAYLSDSAVRRLVTMTRPGSGSNSSRTTAVARSSSEPMMLKGGVAEVGHARALTEELRAHDDAEALAPVAGGLGQRGVHDVADRARRDGRCGR